MVDGMVPYGLRGLRNESGGELGIQNASDASITNRQLEWYVPNTIYNQHWVSRHYSEMIVLQAGAESQLVAAELMTGLPTPIEEITMPPVEAAPEIKPTVVVESEPVIKPIAPATPAKPMELMGDIVSPDELEPTIPLPKRNTKEEISKLRATVKLSLDSKGVTYQSNAPLSKLEDLDVEY